MTRRKPIESVPQLEQWMDDNPNHPEKEFIYSRLIACQLLRNNMCLHMQEAQLVCRSVPEEVKVVKLAEKNIFIKNKSELAKEFETMVLNDLKAILRKKNESELAAELYMCDKDYSLYTQIRALLEEVNQFLAEE